MWSVASSALLPTTKQVLSAKECSYNYPGFVQKLDILIKWYGSLSYFCGLVCIVMASSKKHSGQAIRVLDSCSEEPSYRVQTGGY